MINTARMASSSYVKLFFPCSENGADVNPVDVILGATTAFTGVNAGNGLKVTETVQAASTTISAGTFPTISATQSVIMFAVMGAWAGAGSLVYGDTSTGSRILMQPQFAPNSVSITTSDSSSGITGLTVADTTNPHGYAVAINRGVNCEYLVDGVVTGTPGNAVTGTLNPPVNELGFSHADFYGMALFVIEGSLPSDYKEALAWMSARWAIRDKSIWPAWVNA
jgi:hypothetical protein